MFYCDPCAKKKGWPNTYAKSQGPCEVCLKVALCNDMPSKLLSTFPTPLRVVKDE